MIFVSFVINFTKKNAHFHPWKPIDQNLNHTHFDVSFFARLPIYRVQKCYIYFLACIFLHRDRERERNIVKLFLNLLCYIILHTYLLFIYKKKYISFHTKKQFIYKYRISVVLLIGNFFLFRMMDERKREATFGNVRVIFGFLFLYFKKRL